MERVPSSSKMIKFEFSNGHSHERHVPTSLEDDEYVEYPLQNVEGFPCNVEEEERMLMEAVLLSLKDLDVTRPIGDEQPREDRAPMTTDPTAASTASSSNSPSQFMSPCNSTSSAELSSNTTPSVEESGATTTTSSVGVCSSSNADLADGTKATVTVVKSPSSNIMEGLLRRWDLNFFKNR